MKKKIVGILVCTLLIATAVVLVPGQPSGLDIRVKEITDPESGCLNPSVQPIDAIVENVGSVVVLDHTCYAKIYHPPDNPIPIYEDFVTNIDLLIGDTETVAFDDYNFVTEGVYKLTINIPCVGDVNSADNLAEIFICVQYSCDSGDMIDDIIVDFETFEPPRLPQGKYNPPHNYLEQAKDKITSGMTGDPCDPDNQVHLDIAKDRLNKFIGNVEDLVPDYITLAERDRLIDEANSIIDALTYCIPCE